MDEHAAIAQNLYPAEGSLRYDAACKRVLSEKAILARIVKSCLEEYRDCDPNEIAQRYIEGQPQVSSLPVLPNEPSPMTSATAPSSPVPGSPSASLSTWRRRPTSIPAIPLSSGAFTTAAA